MQQSLLKYSKLMTCFSGAAFLGGDCNDHIFFLLAKAWQGVLLTEQYVLRL